MLFRSVRVSEVAKTARFVCTTDDDMCQIASFYAGAMAEARLIELLPVAERVGGIDLMLISPDDPAGMLRHAEECRQRGYTFAVDPSQQLARMDGEQIRTFITGAAYLFSNDYEWELLRRKTGWTEAEVLDRVGTQITTLGEKGVEIITPGTPTIHVSAVPEKTKADPTGVGDGFRAGLLAGLTAGLTMERAAQLGSYIAVLVLATAVIAPLFAPVLPIESFIRYQKRLGIEPPKAENQRTGGLIFRFGRLEAESFLVANKTLNRQNGRKQRRNDSCGHDQYGDVCSARPTGAVAGDALKGDSPGGEQHGIDGCNVVILALEHNEDRQNYNVRPPEYTIAFALTAKEEPDQPAKPEQEQQRPHDDCLIEYEGERPTDHVTAGHADVVHQLKKRKVVADEPDKVGQEDKKCGQGSQPEPAAFEKAALRCDDDCSKNAEYEKCDRIFGFKTHACEHAEPEPVFLVATVDRSDHAPDAAEPDQRLKGVHGDPVEEDHVDGDQRDAEGSHGLGEASAAEFTRQLAGKPDCSCSSQGGRQSQGEQRAAQ